MNDRELKFSTTQSKLTSERVSPKASEGEIIVF